MALRVNTNVAAMNAYRNLAATDSQMGKSLEKLSSGYRINRASDDAAGLVNSEKLRSQVSGLKVATRNAQDGISVAQTAEGALNEVHSMLQRMRDLSVQKLNTGANSTSASTAIDNEYAALGEEISRMGTATKFNGVSLLDGSYNSSFQVGADDGDTVDLDLSGVDLAGVATSLGATAGTVATVDTQIDAISTARGTIGAVQNRLEHTVANLGVAVENLSASESRVRDTDVAQEMTTHSRNQILSQAGTAMLAQANSSTQGVLQLLRG